MSVRSSAEDELVDVKEEERLCSGGQKFGLDSSMIGRETRDIMNRQTAWKRRSPAIPQLTRRDTMRTSLQEFAELKMVHEKRDPKIAIITAIAA